METDYQERVTRKVIIGWGVLGLLALGSAGALPAEAATAARVATRMPARATAKSAASVGQVITIAQTWNNCGPASVAEVLNYWGIYRTQSAVAAVLRVDGTEHGMGPYGVPAYARTLGMRALIGVAGTPAVLKALIAHGYPVIVTQWVSVADHTSHYRPLIAYDDNQGVFTASDPLLGANHTMTYADFAQMWAPDHNRFLVLYPPSRQAAVQTILSSVGWTTARAYAADLVWAHARAASSYAGVPSWTYPVAAPGAQFLRLAWDEAQLGHRATARLLLSKATAQGAAPQTVSWIAATLN